jgi:assimilatory nitrate reductase catalytic subunit
MSQSSLQTTCAYCGVGCGVKLPRINDRSIKVTGDVTHPANLGRLCVKGTHLGDVLPLKDRLLHPSINDERVSWDTASKTIAEKIQQSIDEHGPDSVAFYLSGQLLTEDYYAANKLAKGFIGTANVDTNSRLCMSSAVAAHIRAFGEDAPPVNYEDLEQAELVILTGSNLAWAHPVLFQRLQQARKDNPNKKLVVIDPRKTATAKEADLHLPLAPGTDGYLFNALLVHLADQNALNESYLAKNVTGFDDTLAAARSHVADSIAEQAEDCGLTTSQLTEFFELFKSTAKTTTVWSMGINQSESGVDKGNAIINAHLATGRIGKAGATAFSITGQPNAMGGREVGGLANQLAAHRMFDDESIKTVGDFWQAKRMATKPGLKAVDLFDACHDGKIKVLWIMATNPVASLPDANKIKAALKNVETVIVSDVVNNNDTLPYADIKLPALAWAEKDGTVTNTERMISRQRAFLFAPGQAKSDWSAIAEVAKQLGHTDAFDWHNSHEVFREHAQLSTINSNSPLKFDLSDAANLSFRDYQDWTPKQWPLTNGTSTPRLFGNGQFSTSSGKATMVPVTPVAIPAINPDTFVLNTGRFRDQWHTMSRTGFASTLTKHTNQFEIHVNPNDALKKNIKSGDLVEVQSSLGTFFALARLDEGLQSRNVFASMHWNDTFSNKGGVSNVIEATIDPISGQPASKHSTVNIQAKKITVSGFYFVKNGSETSPWLNDTVAFKTITQSGTLYQFFKTDQSLADFKESLELKTPYDVTSTESDRAVTFKGDENGMYEWIAAESNLCEWPDIDYLDFAAKTSMGDLVDQEILNGYSDNVQNLGKIICTCFSVTDRQIQHHFKENPEGTLEGLQKELKCSTNCGSCLSEVKELTDTALAAQAEFVDAG